MDDGCLDGQKGEREERWKINRFPFAEISVNYAQSGSHLEELQNKNALRRATLTHLLVAGAATFNASVATLATN